MTTGWGARRPGRCTTGVAPPNASAAEEKARDMAAELSQSDVEEISRSLLCEKKSEELACCCCCCYVFGPRGKPRA